MTPSAVRRWIATADAAPARWARRSHRAVLRLRARARSGSVAAEMDRIVADACDTTRGSGLEPTLTRRRGTDRT